MLPHRRWFRRESCDRPSRNRSWLADIFVACKPDVKPDQHAGGADCESLRGVNLLLGANDAMTVSRCWYVVLIDYSPTGRSTHDKGNYGRGALRCIATVSPG